MVEWYPHVLTVSTLHPISVDKTLNMVEFYYPEEIAAFEREFVDAQQAAYMETCIGTTRSASAWTPAARPCGARRQRGRPLPEPDGGTACSISTRWYHCPHGLGLRAEPAGPAAAGMPAAG